MLSTFIPMTSSWWVSSSTFLQAAALRKAGPAPHLVSKAGLTLLIGVGGEPVREHEPESSGPTLHLPYGGMDGGEKPSLPACYV